MSEVHNLVSDALQAGIPMEEIVSDFAQNGSDEEKDWANRWMATAAKPSYVAGAGLPPARSDDILSKVSQHVNEASKGQLAAEGVATYLGYKGLQLAGRAGNQIIDRWIQNKFPTLSEQAYAEQVAKQGTSAAGAPQGQRELTPLEQARIKTEEVKQANLNSLIAQRETQAAAQEAKARAAAAAITQPAGPTAAPAGVPSAQPQFTVAGQAQPQMQYGATNTTAPAGALTPINPVTPTAGEPVVPTAAPKPVDPVVQAKLDAYAAEERRKQEAHENNQRRLDAEHEAKLNKQVAAAKPKTTTKEPIVAQPITSPAEIPSTDVASRQATQPMVEAGTIKPGKAYGSTDVVDQALLSSQPLIETEKQLEAAGESKPPSKTKAPVVASAEKVADAAEKAKLKWPGGSEGSALQQFFGATKKTLSPEHMASLEMFKDYVGGNLAPSTGGTIKEISQANEFVKKYSGSPLPMGENGKLARLPDEQIAKIHSGIRTELEDAVKGGKLSTLGKGAMAAVTLLGLNGAVQAAQKGDFGPLREAGFDIGGPVAAAKLGLGMLSKAGGLGFGLLTHAGAAGEANEKVQVAKKFAEAQKLGSPYRSVPPPR